MAGSCLRERDSQSDDRAVLVRVRLGEIPRDTSPADGVLVAVDAATARELEADGLAVRVDVGEAGARVER